MKITLLDKYPRSMGHPIQDFVCFNKEQRDKYVNDYINLSDVYISVYATEEVTEDKRKIISSTAIIDKVFFDFDDEDTWLEDLLTLHKWCKERNYIHRCHCSGRGGHVFIFIKPNIRSKKSTISNFQHYIMEKLDVNLDKQIIGDIARIFRYPNTYNYKAKRYCVTLPEELLDEPDLDIDKVYEFASIQRYINPYTNEKLNGFIGNRLCDISHFDDGEYHYNDISVLDIDLDEIDLETFKKEELLSEVDKFPLCIQSMLSTKNPPSKVKYILTKFLQKQRFTEIPYTEDDVIKIFYVLWDSTEFGHWFKDTKMRGHHGHGKKKFISIWNNPYELYSCKQIKHMGLCKFSYEECNRIHPIYN